MLFFAFSSEQRGPEKNKAKYLKKLQLNRGKNSFQKHERKQEIALRSVAFSSERRGLEKNRAKYLKKKRKLQLNRRKNSFQKHERKQEIALMASVLDPSAFCPIPPALLLGRSAARPLRTLGRRVAC